MMKKIVVKISDVDTWLFITAGSIGLLIFTLVAYVVFQACYGTSLF